MTWRELQERVADEAGRLGVSLDDLEVGHDLEWNIESVVDTEVRLGAGWILLVTE